MKPEASFLDLVVFPERKEDGTECSASVITISVFWKEWTTSSEVVSRESLWFNTLSEDFEQSSLQQVEQLQLSRFPVLQPLR